MDLRRKSKNKIAQKKHWSKTNNTLISKSLKFSEILVNISTLGKFEQSHFESLKEPQPRRNKIVTKHQLEQTKHRLIHVKRCHYDAFVIQQSLMVKKCWVLSIHPTRSYPSKRGTSIGGLWTKGDWWERGIFGEDVVRLEKQLRMASTLRERSEWLVVRLAYICVRWRTASSRCLMANLHVLWSAKRSD